MNTPPCAGGRWRVISPTRPFRVRRLVTDPVFSGQCLQAGGGPAARGGPYASRAVAPELRRVPCASFGHLDPFRCEHEVSTKAGQVQPANGEAKSLFAAL